MLVERTPPCYTIPLRQRTECQDGGQELQAKTSREQDLESISTRGSTCFVCAQSTPKVRLFRQAITVRAKIREEQAAARIQGVYRRYRLVSLVHCCWKH